MIGYRRDGGGADTLYEGTDWSCVSDLMPNQDEGESQYARVDCYADGRLIESNTTHLPSAPQTNWAALLFGLLILVAILSVMAGH